MRAWTARGLCWVVALLSWGTATCGGQMGSSPPPLVPSAVQPLPEAPSAVQQNEGQSELPEVDTVITVRETEAERKERVHAEAEHDVKVEEKQRILTVVPNFTTVMSGEAVPLSKGQKMDLAVHATFDPFNLVGAFFLAGASEVTGSDRGFGWGPEGYFKRVGANLADVFDGTMLGGGGVSDSSATGSAVLPEGDGK